VSTRRSAAFFQDLAFIACVALFLLVPIIGMDGSGTVSKKEKRTLAEWPDREAWKRVDPQLGRDLEDWLNDRFYGRENLLDGQAYLDLILNGNARNEDMFTGQEGWLFLKQGNSIDSYQKTDLFVRLERVRVRINMVKRAEWLKAQGAELILLVAPAKNRVYGEMVPSGIRQLDDIGRAEQVSRYIQKYADVPTEYVLEDIQAEKRPGQNWLYFQQDTHWTDSGAFIAYRALMERIQQTHPEIVPVEKSDFQWEDRPERGGDLSALARVDLIDPESDTRYQMLVPSQPYPYHEAGDRSQTVREGRPLKVMVFQDSFGEGIKPFLSSTFGEVLYIPNHHIHLFQDEIRAFQPDLVIHEIAERLIPALLSDQPPLRDIPSDAF
jgi:alginate O-acetyltransferase complex protein AlgJ